MVKAIDKIPAIPAQKCRKCGKEQHKLTHSLCNHCIDTAWVHFVEAIVKDLYVSREWHNEA